MRGATMTTSERRQYLRVSFDSNATLNNGKQSFSCQIIDLSLHGALIRPHGVIRAEIGTKFDLDIHLSESDDSEQSSVKMSLTLAHSTPESLGFVCNTIDLDSITHLRRIIELNSGNTELLERELELLISA